MAVTLTILFNFLSLGVAEVEEGEMTDDTITLHSHTVGRLTFGKPPETKKVCGIQTIFYKSVCSLI